MQEKMAIRLFMDSFPAFDYVETPKDRPGDIDGFIIRKNVNSIRTVASGVEVKCRNMTAHDLKTKYDNKWLITNDKIDRGITLCRSLGIDLRGFLYLVPDKMLYIVPIWSFDKGLVADLQVDMTETQATVNGGTALRLNAYIDVSSATVVAILN